MSNCRHGGFPLRQRNRRQGQAEQGGRENMADLGIARINNEADAGNTLTRADRPADVELAQRIHRLLNQEGYTVRGVQKLLREKSAPGSFSEPQPAAVPEPIAAAASAHDEPAGVDVFRLIALRNRLADAIER